MYVVIMCEYFIIITTYFHFFIRFSKEFFYIYIRSQFTRFGLDNDVKRTSKRSRIFKLLTKMVLNFLNFSTLSQFFTVKLQNTSEFLLLLFPNFTCHHFLAHAYFYMSGSLN